MSSIYLHVPFCKQACYYCDFHFSTSLKKKKQLVDMLCRELELRKAELPGPVESIYFGGGTPSLLTSEEIEKIFETIYAQYPVAENAEITLEANPDDLSQAKIEDLAGSKINRLSIGVQSFFEEDLRLMNRAHNAREALKSIELAHKKFDNISIDLIYGIPGMPSERWQKNLETAIKLGLPHISSYALTVEPNTALKKFIDKGKIKPVSDALAREHFEILVNSLKNAQFQHYEFSNFGQPGYFSRNNTGYWLGKPYLGIGPSAHSFNGDFRKWNISNNQLYIKAISRGKIPQQTEELSLSDKYNEYVMTRLRTAFGIDMEEIKTKFGKKHLQYFLKNAEILQKKEMLKRESGVFHINENSKFLSDGIAADLFFID